MKALLYYFKSLSFLRAIKIILFQVSRKLFNPDARSDFSLSGESSVIDFFFNHKRGGFYVDIGCNHPIKASNTYSLYLKGWTGIAVDGSLEVVKLFKKIRPLDIVCHSLVSDEEKEVVFYEFERSDFNTMQSLNVDAIETVTKKTKEQTIKTRTLTGILDEINIGRKQIDVLSIDVEGHDFNVIKSLDFNKYKPNLIIVEIHSFDFLNINSNEICSYLIKRNYKLIGYISMNAYFEQIG